MLNSILFFTSYGLCGLSLHLGCTHRLFLFPGYCDSAVMNLGLLTSPGHTDILRLNASIFSSWIAGSYDSPGCNLFLAISIMTSLNCISTNSMQGFLFLLRNTSQMGQVTSTLNYISLIISVLYLLTAGTFSSKKHLFRYIVSFQWSHEVLLLCLYS